VDYYRTINELTNQRLGELHSAKLLLYSVNFQEYRPDKTTDWIARGKQLGAIGRRLQDAGADCLLLCANTMHMMADTVQGGLAGNKDHDGRTLLCGQVKRAWHRGVGG
jgi:aspartate racemase